MKKTNVPGSQSFGQKLLQFIRNNTVPIMFILICAYCIPQAGFSWSYLLNEFAQQPLVAAAVKILAGLLVHKNRPVR